MGDTWTSWEGNENQATRGRRREKSVGPMDVIDAKFRCHIDVIGARPEFR